MCCVAWDEEGILGRSREDAALVPRIGPGSSFQAQAAVGIY